VAIENKFVHIPVLSTSIAFLSGAYGLVGQLGRSTLSAGWIVIHLGRSCRRCYSQLFFSLLRLFVEFHIIATGSLLYPFATMYHGALEFCSYLLVAHISLAAVLKEGFCL
jgi:hypothetical protein